MKFRVTSITGSEEGAAVGEATVKFEDALNAALSKNRYGSNVGQVTVVLVTAFDEIEENEKWALPRNQLAHIANEFTGERVRHQSFGVPVDRAGVLGCSEGQLHKHLVKAVCRVLAIRPKRVAAGLNYDALSSAVQDTLSGPCNSAA